MCAGNRELENEIGLVSKLQKPEVGSDVNAAGSSSREDLHSGASAGDDPTVQNAQEVEVEVVIEEMPKWSFLRVFFWPFTLFFGSCLAQEQIKPHGWHYVQFSQMSFCINLIYNQDFGSGACYIFRVCL